MQRVILVVVFLSLACWLQAQVVINEVCPANGDVNYDNVYYNFLPWVELYNAGTSTVNISGYYLSDDLSQKAKWQFPVGSSIPAKGFLLLWCDDLNTSGHTNFTLDSDGEDLILSTPGLLQVDYIKFPKQYTNISYGRTNDGGSTWSYLVSPTPRARNETRAASALLEKPQVLLDAGRYTGTQTVTLTHPVAGVTIYYTLDGSEPAVTSSRYTSPISIAKTLTLKVKAFHDLYIPSETEVKTYFINEHAFTLPVISISTTPAYLWNNTIGIYTDGTNGIPGNCQGNPVNWNQDWDRHAVLEYFDAAGKKEFDQGVDIRIGGACSRNNPQKSFVIKARDKYGKKTIDEKLFDTKPSRSYGGFIFRNSGNDFNVTMFRDALMQSLPIGQMDVDYMAYQPAAFYLNGEYWGIQNLREKIDGDYIESNYGIKKDDIDLVETWGNAIEGTADAYNTYLNTLQTLIPDDPSTFAFIDQHIDVQEFINYLVAEIYYCNTDWPGNNMKFWRQRSINGKFRWILWDTDFGFALYTGMSYATHPTLDFATDPDSGVEWPNPPWSTLHIRLLLQNPEFKTKFIQTLATSMSTTFKPERVNQFIDFFQNRIKTEMPFHKQRWGGDLNSWNYEVQRMRDFAVQRNDFMKGYTASFFGFNEKVRLSVSTTAGSGDFRINGILADEPLINGDYFKGLPYTVEAVPAPGYRFKQWNVRKRESTPVPMIAQGDSWKYFDQGAAPEANWNTVGFNDASWGTGPAQLGYGDGDEQTTVGYGGDASNKYMTTYFRKQFTVDDLSGLEDLQASVLFDDGVVVYLNGVKVYRNNLPAGSILFSTPATEAVPSENKFNSFSIPAGALTTGQNVIAVEVHQNSAQSSDISFDFKLVGVRIGNEVNLTQNDSVVTDIAYTDVILEAQFDVVSPVIGLVINEFSAASDAEVRDDFDEESDWIELYNAGVHSIDLGNLFITDNWLNKTKHRIQPGTGKTILEPGDYKVLWADEQSGQGPLHLNFKLSAEGEQIGLYQMVGNTLQTLGEVNYAAHYAGVSYSRIPNATGPFLLTSQVTPFAENMYDIPVAVEEDREDGIIVYPNPTRGVVRMESEKIVQEITVVNALGARVLTYDVNSTEATLPLNGLSAGLYVLTFRVGQQLLNKRIIIK